MASKYRGLQAGFGLYTTSSGVISSEGLYYTFSSNGAIVPPLGAESIPLPLPFFGGSKSNPADLTGYAFSFGLYFGVGPQINFGLNSREIFDIETPFGGFSGYNSGDGGIGLGGGFSLTYLNLTDGPFIRLDGSDDFPSVFSLYKSFASAKNPLASNPDYVRVDFDPIYGGYVTTKPPIDGASVFYGPNPQSQALGEYNPFNAFGATAFDQVYGNPNSNFGDITIQGLQGFDSGVPGVSLSYPGGLPAAGDDLQRAARDIARGLRAGLVDVHALEAGAIRAVGDLDAAQVLRDRHRHAEGGDCHHPPVARDERSNSERQD